MQAEPRRSMWRLFQPLLLLTVAVSTLLLPALASSAHAQSTLEKTLETRYFTIIYPEGEEASAEWYASFADDVNEAVAEMLGSDPLTGLTLHIYATEADYIAANPMAGDHAGIMAHAIPGQLEIGVAVERLRQVQPEIARESFRHEITHVIAGELSGQNLPIGFQEALAQYNELSTRRAQESAQMLRNAQDQGLPFLSWYDLNDRWSFSQSADLAYPQAYSVMAFLVDSYGMDDFSRFLAALKGSYDWIGSLRDVYGTGPRQLQRDWYAWLPGFLEGGWKTNLLTYYDLSPGVALFEAGHFDEAAEHFSHSYELYYQLSRTSRAAQAGEYLQKARRAGQAEIDATGARTALEAYEYRAARDNAQEAKATFTELGLTTHAQAVDQTFQLAQKGVGAVASMDSARKKASRFDLTGAREDARAASAVFGELGDTARTAQAMSLVAEMSKYSIYIGVGVLAAGLLAVAVGTVVGLRRQRRASRHARRAWEQGAGQANVNVILGKESAEWL
ncbi:MAG: hypothetical protein WCD37_04955 [Chloroflexia bacterium]